MTTLNARTYRSFGVSALQLLIRAYQTLLSPLMFSSCRYYPTCSRYAYEAIELHGAARGIWLAIRRLLRCHPFRRGGFDPVPTEINTASELRPRPLTANQK